MRSILFLSIFVILPGAIVSAQDGGFRWYYTCGDPVCHDYATPGEPLCTDQVAGDPCDNPGQVCDPQAGCGVMLLCTDRDPRGEPGGCPISSERFKRNISYLSEADLKQIAEDVQKIQLTTYRYKNPADQNRKHLGFIIEDNPSCPAVDAEKNLIDLYGYTSMVVAASQVQAREIDSLKNQIEALRQEIKKLTK